MNPVLKNRRTTAAYGVTVALFALLYAAVFGAGIHMGWYMVVDVLVYGMLYGLQGIIIWNIMKYSVPPKGDRTRGLIIAVTGIFVVGSVVGLETLVMYGCLGDGFGLFAGTIAQRLFASTLAYGMFLLYYAESLKDEPAPQPMSRSKQSGTLERITLKAGGKIKVIALSEIEYLQAEGDYVAIVTADGRWLKEQTMKYFEENLPPGRFLRIHRSYMVEISGITRIERYGNLHQVVLRSGEKIKVSASGYKILKEQLDL